MHSRCTTVHTRCTLWPAPVLCTVFYRGPERTVHGAQLRIKNINIFFILSCAPCTVRKNALKIKGSIQGPGQVCTVCAPLCTDCAPLKFQGGRRPAWGRPEAGLRPASYGRSSCISANPQISKSHFEKWKCSFFMPMEDSRLA